MGGYLNAQSSRSRPYLRFWEETSNLLSSYSPPSINNHQNSSLRRPIRVRTAFPSHLDPPLENCCYCHSRTILAETGLNVQCPISKAFLLSAVLCTIAGWLGWWEKSITLSWYPCTEYEQFASSIAGLGPVSQREDLNKGDFLNVQI